MHRRLVVYMLTMQPARYSSGLNRVFSQARDCQWVEHSPDFSSPSVNLSGNCVRPSVKAAIESRVSLEFVRQMCPGEAFEPRLFPPMDTIWRYQPQQPKRSIRYFKCCVENKVLANPSCHKESFA